MAVTAVTITSGPTVVGRTVTISGTLNRNDTVANNNLNFLSYTVGYGSLGTITRLYDNSTVYNAAGPTGDNIPWTWTGALPEGNYLAVTVNLNENPYTLLATSATNVGVVQLQLQTPLSGIWTPRRDSRGRFVSKVSSYPSFYNAGTRNWDKAAAFLYPVQEGIYRSNADVIDRLGEYGGIAKGVPTPYGLGIDAPRNWEQSARRGGYLSTGSGSHVLVSVFSLYNASKYLSSASYAPWPAVLGESRAKDVGYEFGDVAAWYQNYAGEQALRINTIPQSGSYIPGTNQNGLDNIYVSGIGNGLHCLVLCYTVGGGATGVRAFLNGKLVGIGPASNYVSFWGIRSYYYWGSLSQSDLNMGNVHFNANITNLNLNDTQAAQFSLDPYRYFFCDAPKTSSKTRMFSGVMSLPDPPTKFSVLKTNSQPWRQQPTYRAALNSNNPLTRGIIHAGTPHHDVFDAVGSLSWKDSARPPIGTGRSGLFWASAPYSNYQIPSPNNYEGRDQTVLWIVSYEYDSYTGTFPQIKGPSGGDNSGSGIGVRADGNIVYFGGYQSTLIDTGVKIPLRATSVIVLTSNASGTSIYLNGNKIAFTATIYTFDDGYYNSLNRLGYVEAYGNYITVQERLAYPVYTYGVAQWITALSDAQAKQLSQNPWQIFQPLPGRTYFAPANATPFKGGRFLPQRWKTQPQGNVTIDWSSPLAQGLLLAMLPGSTTKLFAKKSNKQLKSSDLGTQVGTQVTVSDFDTIYTANGFSKPDIDTIAMANSDPAVAGSFSIFGGTDGASPVFSCAMAAERLQGAGIGRAQLAVFGSRLRFEEDSGGNISAEWRARDQAGDNAANTHSTVITSQIQSSKLLTLSSVWETGQVGKAYLGTSEISSSNSTIWDGGNGLFDFIEITNNGRFLAFSAFFWLRKLTNTDRASFAENPWQIFKPNPGRIYFLPAPRNKFFFLFN